MAVKKPAVPSHIDFNNEKVRGFLKGGAPVLEDVLEEERKIADKQAKLEEENQLQLISMRFPTKLLKEIDESAKKNYTNRTAWLIEASRKKLKENQ